MVARGVDSSLETCGCGSVEKPCARREMGLAERRAGHTVLDRAADRCECVKVRAEPVRVDARGGYSAPGRSRSGPLASVSTAQSVPVRCDASMSAERVAVT